MRILGISALYHDSAAALVVDGRVTAAAQEERFTRKKHDSGFPRHAIEYCLAEGKCALDELDFVVCYDNANLLFTEHHLAHAASAFFPSPFDRAAVLTLDGVGEWSTTSLAVGDGSDLKIHKELHFPHSLGLLYSAFTYYTGFKVNSGEYKVMGLAPYGEPKY